MSTEKYITFPVSTKFSFRKWMKVSLMFLLILLFFSEGYSIPPRKNKNQRHPEVSKSAFKFSRDYFPENTQPFYTYDKLNSDTKTNVKTVALSLLKGEAGSFAGALAGGVFGIGLRGPLGFIPGSTIGSAVGSTLLILSSFDKKNTSFWWTLLGASIPTVFWALEPLMDDGKIGDNEYPGSLLIGWALSPVGGVIACELTRKRGNSKTNSLLFIERDNISFNMPTLKIKTITPVNGYKKRTLIYEIDLLMLKM